MYQQAGFRELEGGQRKPNEERAARGDGTKGIMQEDDGRRRGDLT